MTEPTERMEFRAGLDSAHGGQLLTPNELAEEERNERASQIAKKHNRGLEKLIKDFEHEAR